MHSHYLELFVPGRLCLFGEHSDWAGGYRRTHSHIEKGYTLICGTDQGIYARVISHPDALHVIETNPVGGEPICLNIPLTPDTLLPLAQQGGYWSYIAGTAYEIVTRYSVQGLVIENYLTTLPVQKGLSSSAAICVLTARAFNQVYNLGLSIRDEMELAYLGEITTPSRCGRMDQGCAFGNHGVLMTFDGDHLDTEEVHVAAPIYMVIVNLSANKDTKKILDQLNDCYPDAENETARGVQNLLGPMNKNIVLDAVKALQQGNAPRLGALMVEAQTLFDRYAAPASPDELASPILHRVLSDAQLQPHVWGGKGVGSQGDGSAQFIARSREDQQKMIEIVEKGLGMKALPLTIRP